MNYKENFMLRLFLVLFSVSVSMTVIPSGIVTAYGIFGEVKASIVTEEGTESVEEVKSVVRNRIHASRGSIVKNKDCSVRQANLYNIWFVFLILVLYLIYASYGIRLPGRDTIVTLKVRMDD